MSAIQNIDNLSIEQLRELAIRQEVALSALNPHDIPKPAPQTAAAIEANKVIDDEEEAAAMQLAESMGTKIAEKLATTLEAVTDKLKVNVNQSTSDDITEEVPVAPKTTDDSKTETTTITPETANIMRGAAALIAAGGIIGALWYIFGGTGLLNMLLMVILPVMAIMASLRLIRWGTVKMLWNADMEDEVKNILDGLRREKAGAAA